MPPSLAERGHIVFGCSVTVRHLFARLSTGLFGEQIRMAIRSHPHPIILRELNSCGRKKKREDTWGYESLPYRYARRTKPTELGQPIVAQRVTLDLINTSEHLRSSCGNLRLNSGPEIPEHCVLVRHCWVDLKMNWRWTNLFLAAIFMLSADKTQSEWVKEGKEVNGTKE